jgi:hypothetical protein
MIKKHGTVNNLKRTLILAGSLAAAIAVVYLYSQPVKAASVACSRQLLAYGPADTPTLGQVSLNSGEEQTEQLAARNTSPVGYQNSTDVDISRIFKDSGGTVRSNAFTGVRNNTMQIGGGYGDPTPESPTGYIRGQLNFDSSPVRGLKFSVHDIEKSTNGRAEEANVLVYLAGSNTPIADLSQYHTTDQLIFSNGHRYTGDTSGAQNSATVSGNVDFTFPSTMEIGSIKVDYTYLDSGDSTLGGSIQFKDISFDGPCIGLAVNATPVGDTVQLDYTIKNTGGLPLTAISLPENLDAIFGAGNYSVVSQPSVISGETSIAANGAFAAGGASDILTPTSALAVDKSSVVRLVVKVKNPAVGGDGKGNYSATAEVSGRPLSPTARRVSDDSVSGAKVDVNGNGDAADDTGPWTVALSSVANVPGIPKTGTIGSISKPLQIAGFGTVALAPLAYLNRTRLLARFKR